MNGFPALELSAMSSTGYSFRQKKAAGQSKGHGGDVLAKQGGTTRCLVLVKCGFLSDILQRRDFLVAISSNMKQSQLFGGTRKDISGEEASKNAILLQRGGYINKTMAGVYAYLPLGLRVLQNVSTIVREEMNALPGAQEVLLPALQPKELWEESGRWNEAVADVMYTVDSESIGLGPTHEEVVTDLFRQYVSSYKELPAAVYQIQTKFRSEPRAKSGLLRGREFLMKDLYSFHTTEESLDEFYEMAKGAYAKVYSRCGLDAILTEASGGMFSKYSHEYQVVAEAGEDTIFINGAGDYAKNKEIVESEEGEGRKESSIEVGNIFKLNRKFSTPMAAQVATESGEKTDVWMGCYGIGISRLIGTIVEVMGDESGKIVWPEEVAPFRAHLIDLTPDGQGETLYNDLNTAGVSVLYDDRDRSAGEKFADADLIGAPHRLIISKRSLASGGVEW
ncbi:MAG: proS, partial [Patescibacteria group bacterium]|nr:proS [Patescibacteria group bacterium]